MDEIAEYLAHRRRRDLYVGLAIGLLLAAAFVAVLCAAAAGAEEPVDTPRRTFDGEPKVLLVNGYSTSFHWPKVLQRKLDRLAGGRSPVRVRTATRGGTPIAKWIDVATGEPRPPYTAAVRPALKAAGETPVIVLAQQSLQWCFGDRQAGIRGPDDSERIEAGADILERYARRLLSDGATQVFIAMHIYKHPMEPEIGHERLALKALLGRDVPGVHAGPDVWAPTKALYPQAFARDGVHPNALGAEVMAQHWFEALLARDGLDVPAWSRQEMNDALKDPPEKTNGGAESRHPRGRRQDR